VFFVFADYFWYVLFNKFVNAVNRFGDVPVPPKEGLRTIEILEEIRRLVNKGSDNGLGNTSIEEHSLYSHSNCQHIEMH
jgi:hypothetical protein